VSGPVAPPPDPTRLGRGSPAAAALKAYASWTRPGERAGIAAWYRLARELDAAAPGPARWPRTWVLSAALTASLAIFLLARAAPTSPMSPAPLDRPGLGGASGEADSHGAGGTRGASGARGAGGTAAVFPRSSPRPAG
jgi:hypothetical protein